MRFARSALAMCVVLLAVTGAAAQTGGLSIVVGDSEGQPLPGAQVTISHATGSIKTTTELTDKKGRVDFPVLRPGGGYSIQISFPGFSPIRYEDLRVRISRVETLQVNMADEFHEEVKVTAQRDVIDLDKSETSTRFSDDFIQDLPVPGRFYQNVLTMAPGVQDADGDGNPNVHGSRSRDFQAVVGNVSNVDPLTGRWMSRINPNSIEEMEVITAGAGVEFGRAQGGFARIIQKQGSNTHEGVVEMYWQTSKLDGDGANDDSSLPDTDFDTYQPSFQFSGPLVRDKLWYRASYEQRDREEPVNILSGVAVETSLAETIDGQVTWQISPRNKLALQFRSDPLEQANLGISSRISPDSSLKRDRDVETYTINWTAPYSPKVLVETTIAWQDTNESQFPTTSGLRNDCVPNADQPFLNAAFCVNNTENTVSGSSRVDFDDHRQRLTVKGQATLYSGRFWGMTHQFKVGLNIENERYFRDLTLRPQIFYQEVGSLGNDNEAPPEEGEEGMSLETFGLVNSVLSVPETDDIRATGTNWGIYAEDQFKPAQNVTVTLGFRLDREEINSDGLSPFDPSAELAAYQAILDEIPPGSPDFVSEPIVSRWPEFFTGFENMPAFIGQLQNILCAGLTGVDLGPCLEAVDTTVLQQEINSLEKKRQATSINLTNTNFSPNIAVAWQPWSNGKTAFKASAGRYYNNLPLQIPLQELNPAQTTVNYRASLTDPDACPPPDPDDENPPIVACGKTELVGGLSPLITVLTVDRNLKTPYQDEFTFKIERELWAETSINLTYVNRKFRDQIQDININLDSGDLGRCQKHTNANNLPLVASPGTSTMSCSGLNALGNPVQCAVDSDCGGGQTCGFFFSVGPDPWLTDPFTGVLFPDTNPGAGDGYFDPVTGSTDDNCVGDFDVANLSGQNDDGCTGALCDNFDFLKKPDEVTDLYLQNPFWGDIFLIGNFNAADYEALVLEIVRRQYRSWEMNASYTYSEAKGDGEDFFQALGDDPTLRDNVRGFQSYDQTHVVKLNATTVTPWGVRLGSSVSWQSGLPFSLNQQFVSFDTLPLITDTIGSEGSRTRQPFVTGVRNDQRNDSFWNFDLKATKELRLGRSLNLQLSAEIFNLFDDGTYQVYNPFLERGIQINGVNEARRRFGRSWQMGMRLSF